MIMGYAQKERIRKEKEGQIERHWAEMVFWRDRNMHVMLLLMQD